MKKDEKMFDIINYSFLVLIAAVMIYPFLNVVAISFSDYSAYLENPFMIIPRKISLEAFKFVFKDKLILSSYRNTLVVTVVSTLLSLMITIITAYPLSRRHFRGKKLFMSIIIFTMLFNGGLIPNFYLIKNLGLIDSLWALILPGALSAYNVILMKSFFEGIPQSLEEAAKIDGASDLYILSKIILPLSTPIIATISLFVAVGHWNSFFNAVVYIRTPEKWTLQLVLREIILAASTQLLQTGGNAAEMGALPPQTLKYATLIVVILPIMCVYPFLQKYFVKGVMIGAVKG